MWPRHEIRAAAGAVTATVGSTLPVFLVGAVGPQIRDGLDFGRSRLGFAIGLCQATSAATSWALGRRVVGIGAARAIRWSVALSAASLLGIALVARSWVSLTLFLAICGVANAIGQPATNALLLEAVAPERLGSAFGVRLGSIPLASLLVGLLVPLVAVPFGWRWTFLAGLVLIAAATYLVPGTPRAGPSARRAAPSAPADRRGAAGALPGPSTPTVALVLLACGVGLAIGTASAVPAFFVESSVDSGLSSGTAGAMLSIGGLAGVIARITIGVRVDNRARTGIGTVAAMVATGSLGLLLLSLPGSAARVGGVVIVFALGWGWVGLFQYLLVSANRSNPGAATGLTDTGGYLGASAGPAAIGVLAERWSFAGVWRLAAGGAVLGALLIRAAGAVARRARRPIEVSGSDRPPAEPER